MTETDLRWAIELVSTTPQLGYRITEHVHQLVTRFCMVEPAYNTSEHDEFLHLGGVKRTLSKIPLRPFVYWTADLYNLITS